MSALPAKQGWKTPFCFPQGLQGWLCCVAEPLAGLSARECINNANRRMKKQSPALPFQQQVEINPPAFLMAELLQFITHEDTRPGCSSAVWLLHWPRSRWDISLPAELFGWLPSMQLRDHTRMLRQPEILLHTEDLAQALESLLDAVLNARTDIQSSESSRTLSSSISGVSGTPLCCSMDLAPRLSSGSCRAKQTMG